MTPQDKNQQLQLARDGFEIVSDVLPAVECEILASELSELHERQRQSARVKFGGLRNLLRTTPQVAAFASSPRIKGILESRLNRKFFPVRALFFDKTTDANWSVPWHQDLSIAVVAKIETAGYGSWSVKDGVLHAQPPPAILEGMVALRLHLDDCNASNGALKVVPGSHRLGKLHTGQISSAANEGRCVVCEVSKGGALLMRPLILHSSSSAKDPSHRRVLHIEYASDELPNGLQWYEK